jgi:hypothetical protein
MLRVVPYVRDFKLKPLTRFHRPDFSPYRNTFEIDYLISGLDPEGRQRWYLGLININTKYLIMKPSPPDTHGALARTLEAVQEAKEEIERTAPGATIHYIRADGDKAFGTAKPRLDFGRIVVRTDNEDHQGLDAVPMMPMGEVEQAPAPPQQQGLWSYLASLPGPIRIDRRRARPTVELGNQEFTANIFTRWLKSAGIEMFLDSSPFTNKVRVIDRAIRTIRDMVEENQSLLFDPDFMNQVVDIYNTRPHSAFDHKFSPLQVQRNPDLEEYYIRENMERLQEVKEMQREAGFLNYKPGNVLLIHLDKSKTRDMFDKKRRAFNEVAIFVGYQNGNVVCDRLTRHEGRIVRKPQNYTAKGRVMIPIYYTKLVAPNIEQLGERFKQLII